MAVSSDPLRALAARWQATAPNSAPRSSAELEANLLPLVRRALRGGPTLPALVGWVRRALLANHLGALAADREAQCLTRLLCDQLLGQFRAAPAEAAETVLGR